MTPLKVDLRGEKIIKIFSGYFHTLALSGMILTFSILIFLETGNLYLWGKGIEMRDIAWGGAGVDRIQRTGNEHLIQFIDSNVVEVSTGPFHCIFSKKDGSIYGIGLSNDGQLGFVENEAREIMTPILLENLKNPEIISCGGYYSMISTKE